MKKYIIYVILTIVGWNYNPIYGDIIPEVDTRLSFRSLSVNDGLSQYSVNAILQDRNGRMVIATYDGLNWFDGYRIESERHSVDRPNGLAQNRILFLKENKERNIWIGLDGGLMLYDVSTHSYKNYSHLLVNLASKRVRSIYEAPDGELWIGTDKELARGYCKADVNKPFTAVSGVESSVIYSITADSKGNLWIGSENGLFLCRQDTSNVIIKWIDTLMGCAVRSLFVEQDSILWIGTQQGLYVCHDGISFSKIKYPECSQHVVRSIVRSSNGKLWLGTETDGLIGLALDPDFNVIDTDIYDKDDFFGRINDNNVGWVFIDRSNVLWIGTRRGVNYASLTPPDIHTFKPLVEHRFSELGYNGKHINTLYFDKFDRLWIGAADDGLFRYDFERKQFLGLPAEMTKMNVFRLLETSSDELWILDRTAIYRATITEKSVMSIKQIVFPDLPQIFRQPSRFYLDICIDRYGDIWIATTNGIIRYNVTTGKNVFYTQVHGLAANLTYSLLIDPDHDIIWAGSAENGMTRIGYTSEGNGIDTEVIREDTSPHQLSNNQVWCFNCCDAETLWIGTDAGLNRMKTRDGKILSLERVDVPYLKDAKILAITCDLAGNLWLNSSQGLYFYNPELGQVNRYFSEDGLQSNTWTEGSAITKNGWIFVGGINGINYFNPAFFQKDSYSGKPLLTSLKINSINIEVGEKYDNNVILKRDINQISSLHLTYNQNNFTLGFSSDHHVAAGKNRFRYRLEGYDDTWVEVDAGQRTASYAHLSPGTYVFTLQTSNNDGVWSDDIHRLEITVNPPWWRSWWAILLYILFSGLAVTAAISYLISRQRWRQKLLIQKLEQDKTQELADLKLNFYTNITHELRTPLALILAPLRDLIERIDDEYCRFRLEIIQKNTGKLLALINHILDIRRVSEKGIPLAVSKYNLIYVVREMIHSFSLMSEQTGIVMHFDAPDEIPDTWFDRDKIEKILQNLISNAYKFTPEQGNIRVKVCLEEHSGTRFACISVQDTGVGIPNEYLDKIFDLFYRGTPLNGYSSGVGLSLAKALIETHSGEIMVDSKEGDGSVFTVKFPIDRDFYPPEQRLSIQEFSPDTSTQVKEESSSGELRSVLSVEDNEDMQSYIKESLKGHFRVEIASDGIEAMSIAQRIKPDVIITDLMMPGMDGIELIRKLKENPRTNFIPIIVHSVKEDKKSIREALAAGAQEYIIKPFDPENLIFRIGNLLNSREHFARKLKAEKLTEPTLVMVPSSDEALLRKIGEIVEQNMQNPMFDIEQLASELGMSRMQLYRRMKKMPGGKTVSEIIRDIRIKRAAQLLASGQMRVTEVMYEVGINYHYRFNKYFQEAYGMNPRDYIRMHSDNN